jgi:hypothetical protein
MDQFFAELKKLLDSLPQHLPPEVTKEIEDAYKQYGFDPKKPPSDAELAAWATQLVYQWYESPKVNVNLPLTGLIIAYNMTTWMKLDHLDQTNLKTLLTSVFNMGYAMGMYNMRSPFDKKPQPQETN